MIYVGGNVMKFIQLSGYSMQIKNIISMENINMEILIKRRRTFGAILLLVLVYLVPFNTAQALEAQQSSVINKVIQAFKQNNRVAISNMVSYPLFRQAPLAPINNRVEFLNRYDEVFDQRLLNTITRSNLHTDWDSIGWRGVILDNGIVALDPDGNITEINYHSPREQALVNKLNPNVANNVAKGRRALHRSVTNYKQAIVELTTERFHIRVDDIGQGKLRYASWPINKNTSDAPDLILINGRVLQNDGRNQRFVFDNGTYSYQLNFNASVAAVRPTGSLEVFKGGQSWIREVATRVIRR